LNKITKIIFNQSKTTNAPAHSFKMINNNQKIIFSKKSRAQTPGSIDD